MKKNLALTLPALLLSVNAAFGAGNLLQGLPEGDFSHPVLVYEEKSFPFRDVEGNPPTNGLRHWTPPLYRMESYGCYVSVINAGTDASPKFEKWENEWGKDASERGMICETGDSFASIVNREQRFSGEILNDVFVPKSEPPTLSPLRGITRTEVIQDSEYGRIAFLCVCPDYTPGGVPLMPAILTSPTGEARTWKYHGMLDGEPQEELKNSQHPIWSDGGSLLRMPDGTWRAYLNNFGNATLCMMTANTLNGPWKFLRDEKGAIRDLLGKERVAPVPNGSCFPHLLRVSDTEWHLWLSDGWPVQSIWHYISKDGLDWKPYGEQPEITRALVNGHGIKCLRTYLSEDKKTIYGFLSVWDNIVMDGTSRKGWRLYAMTLCGER